MWIDWNGGECPVPEGTLIDVWFRIDGKCPIEGVNDLLCVDCSNNIRWSHTGSGGDIVAYRVVT